MKTNQQFLEKAIDQAFRYECGDLLSRYCKDGKIIGQDAIGSRHPMTLYHAEIVAIRAVRQPAFSWRMP